MRRLKRISLALLLAVLMLMQSVAVFAEVSPIVYEVNEDGSITSYVYARGLTNGAKLYTAVYNADGSFDFATASAEATEAGYLKTTVAKEEGQVVKSFLWDKSYSPFVTEGEYDEAIDAEDITITLNGVDLRDYLAEGEELALGGSYDINIKEAGFLSTPIVRASSTDSQVESSVSYNDAYTTATVTFSKSDRILSDDAVEVTNNAGKSFVAERYTKAVKDTVTINFKRTFITDDDLVVGSPTGNIKNENTCNIHYVKDYSLAEGETAKKISLLFASIPSQSTVIIIEPKDMTADKYALVADANGTPVSWTDDTRVVKTFDYSSYKPTEYGKKNESVIATGGTHTAWACKELLFGDNGRQNGSRYLTDRNCDDGGYQIYGIDNAKTSNLQGCNYIIFASGDKSNVTTDFYVGEDVRIHVYTNATGGLTISDVTADATTVWDASCKTTGILNKRYQNSVDSLAVAWLIREGKLKSEDVVYNKNNNVWYDVNGDGKRQYDNSDTADVNEDEGIAALYVSGRAPEGYITGNSFSAYYLRRYDAIDYLIEKSGSDSGWGFSNNTIKKDIPNSVLPYYYSETYQYQDYLDMWYDGKYESEVPELVTDFNHASKFTVEDMPMTVLSGDYAGDTATYTGDVTVADGVKSQIIDFFSLSITPDRTGLKLNASGALENQNATGALVQYPDGFGLEDATFICFNNGPVNDAGYCYASSGYYNPPKASYHDVWINRATCYPWYDFKVTRDAEVLVFATNEVRFLNEDDSYDKIVLQPDDYLNVMRNMNNSTYYSMTRVYSKKVKAGEKVEMKTPGNGEVLYCVFVKEATDPEIDTTLSSLTVNGISVEGFDPEVTEYTYALSEAEALSVTAPVIEAIANDANAIVTVLKPESFPGSSKVVVNHVNGGTTVYTINYTENYEYIENVSFSVEGKIPQYYKGGVVIGDSSWLATDRQYSGAWHITAINDPALVGNDKIIGAVDGYVSGTMLNFTLKRPARIRVLLNNSNGTWDNALKSEGFVLDPDNTTVRLVGSAGTNVRQYTKVFIGEFEAGEKSITFAKPDMPALYAIEYLPFK